MKILVCIKQVPDTGSLITIDSTGKWINESKASFRMNRYDEHAVEEALKIKESHPGTLVHAISVGPHRASAVLRRALEMGADEGFHIITPAGFIDPGVTASLIAGQVEKIPYDLILCGQMAEDDMFSQVGPMIASMLDMPFSTSVISLKINIEEKVAFAERDLCGAKKQKLEIILPCLLAVQTSINRPRYPSLSNVLKAKKQSINTVDSSKLDMNQTIFSITYPEKSASGTFLKGDLRDKAGQLVQILHEHSLV
jgi:electron transfer flavoprotein beta subunit